MESPRNRRNHWKHPEDSRLQELLEAIVADEVTHVRQVLRSHPGLATASIPAARFYETGVYHWIYRGDTALHLAAAGHREKIVKQLLAAGASANCRGPHRGATPLHYAADGYVSDGSWNPPRQVATLQTLMAAGADLGLVDKNGASALHRAVRTRCAAATACLIEAGANATLENNSGSTALHLAVQNTGRGGSGHPTAVAAQRQILTILLQHGSNPHSPNSRGKSPYDSARPEWIRTLLESAGNSATS